MSEITGPSQKIVFELADRGAARRLATALEDLIEPAPAALTLFEQPRPTGDGLLWRIEAYYDAPPEPRGLRGRVESVLDEAVPVPSLEDIPAENWVALSQAALPPVHAGRFTVHGSHDRARVARGPNAILIDAGEAFGTAHHATTAGALAAIDRLTRRGRYFSVLDLGCGSGVLAIALARALASARITASDVDRQSVAVARANIRANGAGARIKVLTASGLDAPELRRARHFDLIVANILAGPLIRLAGKIARAEPAGGRLVLSGILVPQAAAVIAAYLCHGYALETHDRIGGWSTLVLRKRGIAGARRRA